MLFLIMDTLSRYEHFVYNNNLYKELSNTSDTDLNLKIIRDYIYSWQAVNYLTRARMKGQNNACVMFP